MSLNLTAGYLGHLSKQIVRLRIWDRRRKVFRFQNSWHYILKGEFFDFPRAAYDLEVDKVEDIEMVFVDALVNTNDGTVIYDGILVDYELSSDGGLETITFKESERRFLKNDSCEQKCECSQGEVVDSAVTGNKKNYYKIPGHLLILKYSEILNLNFTYYKITKDVDNNYDVIQVE